MKGILGTKLGMTQVFTENGILIPVTVLEVQDNIVIQVKNDKTKDNYVSTTLAAFDKRENLVNKPDLGQFKKINSNPKRYIKEIKKMEGYKPGDIIKVDLFSAGELVDATSISKGKGFAGSIKRHGYSRGPMGHGSGYHRGVGSMGPVAPNRIFKSKKMPGHMGCVTVTIQNLEVIAVNVNKKTLLIKGSIPGPKKQLIVIKNAIKKINKPFKNAAKLLERNNTELVEVSTNK